MAPVGIPMLGVAKCTIIVLIDMALPPRDQRHQYHRYEGLQYTDADIADFKTRLARIYKMPPKRTSTSAAPAMTQDAIRQLVADSVATALKAQATNIANLTILQETRTSRNSNSKENESTSQ
ncbi:hypothetical protein Tco_0185577 [Tanacetum coccineum]